jgi:hypothetical protein
MDVDAGGSEPIHSCGVRMKRRSAHLLISLLAAIVLTGCGKKEPVMLGIVGYNHTDRYIDSFSVGGQGGGNVFATSSGGIVCCIGYRPSRPLPIEMDVEWTFGYRRNEQGEIVVPSETHQKTAILNGPVPKEPHYLEVHIFADSTVQLRIVNYPSPFPAMATRKQP